MRAPVLGIALDLDLAVAQPVPRQRLRFHHGTQRPMLRRMLDALAGLRSPAGGHLRAWGPPGRRSAAAGARLVDRGSYDSAASATRERGRLADEQRRLVLADVGRESHVVDGQRRTGGVGGCRANWQLSVFRSSFLGRSIRRAAHHRRAAVPETCYCPLSDSLRPSRIVLVPCGDNLSS